MHACALKLLCCTIKEGAVTARLSCMSLLNATLALRRKTAEIALTQWLALLLVAVIPFSTTATGVVAGLFFAAFCFRGDFQKLRWHWRSPVVLSSAALFALVVIGVLWSNASVDDIVGHGSNYIKVLFIPMLVLVLARGDWPERGIRVWCIAMLVLIAISLAHYLAPDAVIWSQDMERGTPFRSYTMLNIASALLAYGAVIVAFRSWSTDRMLAVSCLVCAALLIAYILSATPSRTGILVMLALSGLACLHLFRLRGMIIAVIVVALLGAVAFYGSQKVRDRFLAIPVEVEKTIDDGVATSSGIRWTLWTNGVDFVLQKPVLGHGTGSVQGLYETRLAGQDNASAIVTADPHNQILALVIPFGIPGLIVLVTFWGTHGRLFYRSGFYAALGQAFVLQCIVGCMFFSFIMMFAMGWFYVTGVSILLAAIWRDQRYDARSRVKPVLFERLARAGVYQDRP